MAKSVVVFGLGQFGRSLALSLSEAGADVMAVDKDEELVESIAEDVTEAKVADLENADAIKELGIGNMDVAVVGGGEIALNDALYLSYICNKVYIIYKEDEFKYIDKIKDINNIELILNSQVTKIIGDNKVNSIEINDKDIISVEGLFVAIVQFPENGNFRKYVDLDDNGYIISDDCTTKTKGIFVAGDNRVKEL